MYLNVLVYARPGFWKHFVFPCSPVHTFCVCERETIFDFIGLFFEANVSQELNTAHLLRKICEVKIRIAFAFTGSVNQAVVHVHVIGF